MYFENLQAEKLKMLHGDKLYVLEDTAN